MSAGGKRLEPHSSAAGRDQAQPQVYATLREKIAAEKAERLARYAGFAALWAEADAAGLAAEAACQPQPMLVTEADGKPIDVVLGGAYGSASVTVFPGNCSFARWAAKEHKARKAYSGGMRVRYLGIASLARNQAYASAFAERLRQAGIKAFSDSRMD